MRKRTRDIPVESDPLAADLFRCHVINGGHSVIRAAVDTAAFGGSVPTSEEDVLVATSPTGMTETAPLADPELFLAVGATPATAEGIVAFANTHGLLGVGGRVIHLRADGPWKTQQLGERLADWKHEILAVRAATRVWDATHDRDLPALHQYVCRLKDLEASARIGGAMDRVPGAAHLGPPPAERLESSLLGAGTGNGRSLQPEDP